MKTFATNFHCQNCGNNLEKVEFHNLYICKDCGKKFRLPKEKEEVKRKIDLYDTPGPLFQMRIIRGGRIIPR